MKACPKCQHTNGTDTWLCQCGYEFDGSEPLASPSPPKAPNPKPRWALRIALIVLTLSELFVRRNMFLFGAYRIQPGVSQESALVLMGDPDVITDYSNSKAPGEDQKEWLLAEHNTTWAYRVEFCGITLGVFHAQFDDGKVARTSLDIAGHHWGALILPQGDGSSSLKLPEPSVP